MIKGSIHYIGSPRAMARGMPRIVQESMKEAAALWHRQDLPKHFEEGASSRYGYKARDQKYRRRKQRKKGHGRPLEWSGELKRAVTRMARITGSRLTVRASMDVGGAWYATRRWLTRDMPDMPRELTAITHDEERGLAREVERSAEEMLNRVDDRETLA